MNLVKSAIELTKNREKSIHDTLSPQFSAYEMLNHAGAKFVLDESKRRSRLVKVLKRLTTTCVFSPVGELSKGVYKLNYKTIFDRMRTSTILHIAQVINCFRLVSVCIVKCIYIYMCVCVCVCVLFA